MSCALCGKNEKLMQSHIIPKLVYTRIKSNKRSRFRSIDNIRVPLQDGEKRQMLCRDCEQLFSSYEVKFANQFLDRYLNSESMKNIKCGVIQNYILTVAWRVLWDDLYRLNSHKDHVTRVIFEEFCDELKTYLIQIGNGNNCMPPKQFKNYVFSLKELIKDERINKFAEASMFGYSVYFSGSNAISVIVYYAGLIFVTDYQYDKSKYMFIGTRPIIFRNRVRKKEITEEIILEFTELMQEYRKNMTPELAEKIQKYYDEKNP